MKSSLLSFSFFFIEAWHAAWWRKYVQSSPNIPSAGIGGEKCDECAIGFVHELPLSRDHPVNNRTIPPGQTPNCQPCGECFDNWNRILEGELNQLMFALLTNLSSRAADKHVPESGRGRTGEGDWSRWSVHCSLHKHGEQHCRG